MFLPPNIPLSQGLTSRRINQLPHLRTGGSIILKALKGTPAQGGGLGCVGTGPHTGGTGSKSWLSGSKAEQTGTALMDNTVGDVSGSRRQSACV